MNSEYTKLSKFASTRKRGEKHQKTSKKDDKSYEHRQFINDYKNNELFAMKFHGLLDKEAIKNSAKYCWQNTNNIEEMVNMMISSFTGFYEGYDPEKDSNFYRRYDNKKGCFIGPYSFMPIVIKEMNSKKILNWLITKYGSEENIDQEKMVYVFHYLYNNGKLPYTGDIEKPKYVESPIVSEVEKNIQPISIEPETPKILPLQLPNSSFFSNDQETCASPMSTISTTNSECQTDDSFLNEIYLLKKEKVKFTGYPMQPSTIETPDNVCQFGCGCNNQRYGCPFEHPADFKQICNHELQQYTGDDGVYSIKCQSVWGVDCKLLHPYLFVFDSQVLEPMVVYWVSKCGNRYHLQHCTGCVSFHPNKPCDGKCGYLCDSAFDFITTKTFFIHNNKDCSTCTNAKKPIQDENISSVYHYIKYSI